MKVIRCLLAILLLTGIVGPRVAPLSADDSVERVDIALGECIVALTEIADELSVNQREVFILASQVLEQLLKKAHPSHVAEAAVLEGWLQENHYWNQGTKRPGEAATTREGIETRHLGRKKEN